LDAYRTQQIRTMSKEELVLAAFELGVKGCLKKDRRLVKGVLMELIAGLDFSYKEMAGNFLVLYDYAIRRVREGDFETPRKILAELRSAWEEALRKESG